MNTLTVRLPDDIAARLKSTAKNRGISVNKLIAEISIQALSAYDAENHFRLAAQKADTVSALKLLDKIDRRK